MTRFNPEPASEWRKNWDLSDSERVLAAGLTCLMNFNTALSFYDTMLSYCPMQMQWSASTCGRTDTIPTTEPFQLHIDSAIERESVSSSSTVDLLGFPCRASFTGRREKKYPKSICCVEENVLLMPGVRGQKGSDCWETHRKATLTQITSGYRIAPLNAPHVLPRGSVCTQIYIYIYSMCSYVCNLATFIWWLVLERYT